jgi:hypothetical protein
VLAWLRHRRLVRGSAGIAVSLPELPNISGANEIGGAKRGANNGSHQATAGHGQLSFSQLNALSGDAERCPAIPQMHPYCRVRGYL